MLTRTRAPEREPFDIAETGPAGPPALRTAGLRHGFGELRVLDGIDLELEPGGVLGIVGPSGCGKSTLLELACGLRDPDAGALETFGAAAAAERLAACAYLPQRDLLLPWYSALDNASLALRNRGVRRAEARRAAAPLFERFGLAGFEDARPAQLSGGMRQRVAFLRTLIAGKPLLLLDEPFASLDAITRAEMQEWLAEALRTEPRSIVLVTHDVEEALYLCDRVAILSPRPARVLAVLPGMPGTGERTARVTSPEFVALRERAMRVLRGEGR